MLKILFADDEPIVIDGLKLMIDWEKLGVEIVGAAYNGQTALDMIEQLRPDIVLTDIQMPCINGIELLKVCAEKKYNSKFIMLTSYGELDYVRGAMKYGAMQYLMKPLEPDEITKAVDEVRIAIYKEHERELENHSKIKAVTQETFQRVLFGEHSDKLYNRAGFILGTDIDNSFLVTILRSETEMTDEEYSEFKEKIRPFMQNKEVVHFSVGNKTHIFIQTENDNCSNKEIAKVGSEYFTGIYTIFINGIHELASAYMAATDRFANLTGCVENIEISKQKKDSRITTDAGETLKLAMNGRHEEAFKKIDEDFYRMEGSDNKIEYASRYISSFIISMCRYSNMTGMNMESLFDDALTAVNNVYDLDAYRMLCRECLEQYLSLSSHIESLNDVMLANNIINYMRNNSSKKVTIASISKEMHIHSALISKLIKIHTGMKFNDYLHYVRIQNAKQLIANTNVKITQIASDTGYSDYYYFTSKFKELTGELPSDYRKSRK